MTANSPDSWSVVSDENMGDAGIPHSSVASFRRARIDVRPRHRQLPALSQDEGDVATLPELIEFNAKYNPDHVFCLQTLTGFDIHRSEQQNFLRVTHGEFHRAVGACQEWLRSNVPGLELPSPDAGKGYKKGPAIAILMESDICLFTYLSALVGLGIPTLLLSARLSPTAIENLLRKTNARWILTTPRLKHKAEESTQRTAGDDGSMERSVHLRAEFDKIYKSSAMGSSSSKEKSQSICHPGHYISEDDRDVLILHSSGTTGLPKPIFTANRYLLGYAACHDLQEDEVASKVNLSTLPLYHGFGLLAPGLSMSIGLTVCFPPSSIIPSADSTLKILELSKANFVMTVPAILEEIAASPEETVLASLKDLGFVLWGGGPLKAVVREKLAELKLNLVNHSGATEVGALGSVFVPDETYNSKYIRFRQDMGLKFDKVESEDGGAQQWTMNAYPFGWEEPFVLQDKLVTNSERPGVEFEILGRNDDLLVLGTGEKVLPQILELTLASKPGVKAALAFGEGQFEVGVIVEPLQPVTDVQAFKSELWPTVLEAGTKMDSHARVSSLESVLIVSPGTLPRSDKGSVMRKEAYKLLDSEITKVYQNLENQASSDDAIKADSPTFAQDLRDLLLDTLEWKGRSEEFAVETDFFEFGMDSLQAVRFRRALLPTLLYNRKVEASAIPRDFLYRYPSISAIVQYVQASGDGVVSMDQKQITIESTVDDQVRKLSEMKEGACVLLTGSTGSLGSHLVHHLCEKGSVNKLVCLVRKSTSKDGSDPGPLKRQIRAMAEKGLDLSDDGLKKLEVIETNTAEPYLGIPASSYRELSMTVTHILHNAWPVDFMRHFQSFGAQFDTLRGLLHLAREIHFRNHSAKPTLQFVSSIATIGRYGEKHDSVIVTEDVVSDVNCTNGLGYAEAKLACEMMLETARTSYGDEINVRSVRVGQMSGARQSGYWKSSEHFPALVKSSKTIGVLPQVKGVCDLSSSNTLTFTNAYGRHFPGYQWTMQQCACPRFSLQNRTITRSTTLKTLCVKHGRMCWIVWQAN